jgi:hypothetical protein
MANGTGPTREEWQREVGEIRTLTSQVRALFARIAESDRRNEATAEAIVGRLDKLEGRVAGLEGRVARLALAVVALTILGNKAADGLLWWLR